MDATWDWRDIRTAVQGAQEKLGRPDFYSLPEDERNRLWDFAEAVIKSNPRSSARCVECKKEVEFSAAYRCADCKGVCCERCIKPHFGPQHKPHT
jgi:hypothetical protein